MLTLLGYRVSLAKNGQEALRLYKKARQSTMPFAAVILDLLVHHGMGGKECLERLLKFDPEVKALVCSGYSDDPVMADYQKYGFRQRLPKPFKIEELGFALKRLLR
jgi:DNA-binding NtrC family response regulator